MQKTPNIAEDRKQLRENDRAVSGENMSSKMEDLIEIYKDHDGRITDLEKQPGDMALKRSQWIAIAVGSGAIGMLFTVIGAIAMGILKIKG